MRVLKFETFKGWSINKELVDFINQKGIKQEDILKIAYLSGAYALFYYVEE